jgi:hypothetical protein
LRTDLRRRIEKTVHQCPRVPAERTRTILAYLASPVKRKNPAVRGSGVWSHLDARRTIMSPNGAIHPSPGQRSCEKNAL